MTLIRASCWETESINLELNLQFVNSLRSDNTHTTANRTHRAHLKFQVLTVCERERDESERRVRATAGVKESNKLRVESVWAELSFSVQSSLPAATLCHSHCVQLALCTRRDGFGKKERNGEEDPTSSALVSAIKYLHTCASRKWFSTNTFCVWVFVYGNFLLRWEFYLNGLFFPLAEKCINQFKNFLQSALLIRCEAKLRQSIE